VTRAAGAALVAAAALVATVLAQSDVDVIKITLGRADIRSEPSQTAPLLRQVTEGTYLIVIKEDAGWFQVQLPASRGLRALGYLQKTSAVRVKPAEAAAALEAMRRPPSKPPGDSIVIGAEVAPKTIWLKAQATQRFPVAEPVTTVAAAASSASVTRVLGAAAEGVDPGTVALPPGVNDATWIWVTRASAAAPVLASRRPSFYVFYGEVPGLDSREWAPYVVRLSPAGEWLVITALAGPALAMNYWHAHWEIRRTILQNEMASTITGLADGMVRLTLTAPLAPGEYALVIRPAFWRRSYAGRQILSDEGPGVAFGAAWVFSVK
jgi:hypothetical protein